MKQKANFLYKSDRIRSLNRKSTRKPSWEYMAVIEPLMMLTTSEDKVSLEIHINLTGELITPFTLFPKYSLFVYI